MNSGFLLQISAPKRSPAASLTAPRQGALEYLYLALLTPFSHRHLTYSLAPIQIALLLSSLSGHETLRHCCLRGFLGDVVDIAPELGRFNRYSPIAAVHSPFDRPCTSDI